MSTDAPPEPEPPPEPCWHPLTRIGFRFALIYFVLYAAAPELLWDPIVSWVGPELLGVEVRYRPNGSGDTTYNYLQWFVTAALAAVGSLLWSALARERRAHPRLAEWLLVAARYYLALMMIGYGFAKLFQSQFSQPGLDTLIQPYGEASPMGLAWVFMGASPVYQTFAGLLEFVAGLLLLSRRTTTAGALLGAAVMSNVVMLNFCFDIPVKLFSSHLLLLALAIAACDGRRVLAALLGHRGTQAVDYPPHFRSRKLQIASRFIKALAIAAVLIPGAYLSWQGYVEYGAGSPRSPIYGIYQVSELREDGQLRPATFEDGERWRYLTFDHPAVMGVQQVDGTWAHYGVTVHVDAGDGDSDSDADMGAGTMVVRVGGGEPFSMFLLEPPPPQEPTELTWELETVGSGQLHVSGEFEGKQLDMRLDRVEREFLLTSRGFHWVNETPLNR